MKTLTVLGSTGSIGSNTLDVIRRRRDEYRVFALVAGSNVDTLASQILEFHPRRAIVASEAALRNLISRLRDLAVPESEWPDLAFGPKACIEAATDPEVNFVMSAIVGVAGLEATYEAVRRGTTVGLANKEVLVASGQLVIEASRRAKAELIPVDSEHNGVHQCLRGGERHEVSKVILTASGGPFRETPEAEMANVTPAQALKHPTWKMGKRITIDSATMMNKGFEVIEACWLFDMKPADVQVVIHPQSSVHAMVEYTDGSILAQISTTDMRMPIQYALTYPARDTAPVPRVDWSVARHWDFNPPDMEKFRLLKLAYHAQEAGGSATCTLNAADEIAVDAFLNGRISFPGITAVVEETLDRMPSRRPGSVQEVLAIDVESRSLARELVRKRAQAGSKLAQV